MIFGAIDGDFGLKWSWTLGTGTTNSSSLNGGNSQMLDAYALSLQASFSFLSF